MFRRSLFFLFSSFDYCNRSLFVDLRLQISPLVSIFIIVSAYVNLRMIKFRDYFYLFIYDACLQLITSLIIISYVITPTPFTQNYVVMIINIIRKFTFILSVLFMFKLNMNTFDLKYRICLYDFSIIWNWWFVHWVINCNPYLFIECRFGCWLSFDAKNNTINVWYSFQYFSMKLF